MSDPVTNVNIDDVLSSIRRLVAEGERSKSAVPPSAEAESGAQRLVLTPDFRVSKPQDEKAEAAAREHDPEPAEEQVPLVLPSMADRTKQDAPEAPAPLLLTPEQSIPKDDAVPPVAHESLEATIAALETRISGNTDEWEPDGSEVTTEPTWASAGFVAAPRDRMPEADVDTTEVKVPEPKDEPSQAETVEDALAAAIVTQSMSQKIPPVSVAPEPAPEQTFIARARPHRWSQEASQTSPSAREEDDADYGDELAQPAAVGMDDTLDRYLSQAPMIDEAAMRQIVQEVVREELQGGLGERITRNVRKLVRKEINNLLTHQDFS